MPRYEFRCESCEKGFEMTLTLTERANAEVNCPNCGSEKGHPSAHGLHSQDLAEELKTKGVLWRRSLGVGVGRSLGALSLVCCSVQERYGNEKIHRVLGVTSSQGTKTNQPTTIGSDEAPRAARRAAHQFELVV
jgi:putative FmdB family regulatory protein